MALSFWVLTEVPVERFAPLAGFVSKTNLFTRNVNFVGTFDTDQSSGIKDHETKRSVRRRENTNCPTNFRPGC